MRSGINMKKRKEYEVGIPMHHYQVYKIIARSKKEALEIVNEDKGVQHEQIYSIPCPAGTEKAAIIQVNEIERDEPTLKVKREYAGCYTFMYGDDRIAATEIKRGHWELLLNGEYFDTACSYSETKAHVYNYFEGSNDD